MLFFALLCATAQQSGLVVGVHRPCVCRHALKPIFSEVVIRITTKLCRQVALCNISRPFLLLFLKTFFPFSLTWNHREVTFQMAFPLKLQPDSLRIIYVDVFSYGGSLQNFLKVL